MVAPTVDITNMNTSKLSSTDDTEIYQQKAILSSKNMFSLAQASLENNPSLKRIILMEHPSRFDRIEDDPISLKPKLAKIANATLGQLWMSSPLKNKIVIGNHSLVSSGDGDAHFSRYQHSNTGRYDGVHFYGQKGCRDYTDSVKSILMLALTELNSECGPAQNDIHNSFPQAKYQSKPANTSFPTKNRFSMFNQGN